MTIPVKLMQLPKRAQSEKTKDTERETEASKQQKTRNKQMRNKQ